MDKDLIFFSSVFNFAYSSLFKELLMQNALDYVKMLEEKGVPKEQAEATVSVIHSMIYKDFATKNDLEKLETRMDHKFDVLEQKIDYRFKQLEDRMTIKLGGMLTLFVAMVVAIQKIL